MATGKTDSRYVVITLGGTAVTCSVNSLGGVGLTHTQNDITTLCNDIMEMLQGVGDVNITLSGPFDNGTNGMYTVARPLADAGTLTTLNIDIGIGAAPTTGDPRFALTNVILFDYLVAASAGSNVTDSVTVRGGQGVTASWTTV